MNIASTARLLIILGISSTLGFAQLGALRNKIKPGASKDEGPAGGIKEAAFNRETYTNLLNYAEGVYNQREAFRFAVDRQYESKVREHSDRAREVNLSAKSEIVFVLEDRYRKFSGLYDNLLMQDVVNNIGQEVVPKWAERLVTFKIIADPVPRAEAISTGTVYVTTGLVAMMDNKAQLAYVLAHEAAHVVKDHWKTRVKIELAKELWAAEAEDNKRNMQAWGSLVGTAVGAAAGAAGGRTMGTAALGGGLGAIAGYAIATYLMPAPRFDVEWNRFEEDEADQIAAESLLGVKLDVRQVPDLYARMDKLALRDDRVGMGFWGSRGRMKERLEEVRKFLQEKVKPTDTLVGNDPEFRTLVAELKRDNGIFAYYQDMLDMSRSNLEQAAAVRNADPNTLYYYGKILKATARTDEERAKALKQFEQAMQRDDVNHVYGAYLHTAISLVDGSSTDKARVRDYLEQYVDRYGEAYRAVNSPRRDLPPHMDTLVDYLRRAGIREWKFSNPPAGRMAAADSPAAAPVTVIPAGASAAAPAAVVNAVEDKKRAVIPAGKKKQ